MTHRDTIAAMLRDGATYAEIRAAVGCGYSLISTVRREHGIPLPTRPRPCRTPEQTYHLYAIPAADGHRHWTGPWAGRMPQIQHPSRDGRDGRKESALRIGFRLHHGRDPTGRVFRSCGDLTCVAGPHLTDAPLRAWRHALNSLTPPTTKENT